MSFLNLVQVYSNEMQLIIIQVQQTGLKCKTVIVIRIQSPLLYAFALVQFLDLLTIV